MLIVNRTKQVAEPFLTLSPKVRFENRDGASGTTEVIQGCWNGAFSPCLVCSAEFKSIHFLEMNSQVVLCFQYKYGEA